MYDLIIPLVFGVLITGGVLVVPLLMRSKFRDLNRQANGSKSGALSTSPDIVHPDQNIDSDPKNWLRTVGWRALRILGQIAIGIIAGLLILIVIALLMKPMLP